MISYRISGSLWEMDVRLWFGLFGMMLDSQRILLMQCENDPKEVDPLENLDN